MRDVKICSKCDITGTEILARFAILDPMFEQLAAAVKTALNNSNLEAPLSIDALARMMAIQLAKHHSKPSGPAQIPKTNTEPSNRMQRLMDFIEEHLDGDLTAEAMAGELQISAFYLPRAFKAAVGQSPHQYVLRRRVERARDLLENTDAPVADVAASAGFGSQSHLSHWFKRLLGVSPAIYRRQKHRQQVRPRP
jgi:AraC family transcriptional regulator